MHFFLSIYTQECDSRRFDKLEESDTPAYPELTDISYIHKCEQR